MKNNTYIKKIELIDGILDFNSGIEVYKQYLLTPSLNWKNELRRPIKSNILTEMGVTHSKIGSDPQPLINSVLKNGGNLYFWSDLHLYHHNIIRYAERPFETVEHMNETMINNYWSKVTDSDVVVFGGDVGFGDINDVQNLISQLPGKKILVLGNHDFDKNKGFFRNYNTFDITTMAFTFQKELNGVIYNILVTHYPINKNQLPKNTINIHGHIHQHLPGDKNINMCVEHTGFSPISMTEKIEELILKEYQ
ncbi:hypothetical protein GW796_07930 [archaeon]|nr:hypothetical protein [archaeon]